MVHGDPKFEVKNPAPGLGDCISAMKFGDYFTISAFTVGSGMFGWFTGKPIRPQNASTASLIGFTAGFMYAYQNAYARLMGYTE